MFSCSIQSHSLETWVFSAQNPTLSDQECGPSHHPMERLQAEPTPSSPFLPCPADIVTHPVPRRPRAHGTQDQAAAGAARWAGWSTASAHRGPPGVGPGPLAHPTRGSGAGGARLASRSGPLGQHRHSHRGSQPRSPLWSPLWLWRRGLSAAPKYHQVPPNIP